MPLTVIDNDANTAIINFVNLDTIVLCDRLSHAEKYFMGYLSKEIEIRASKTVVKACEIVISKYTYQLGVVEATTLPKQ